MSKLKKKIEAFLNNPSSCDYADIESVLIHFGFEKINAKGSHVKFKHFKLRNDLIIPVHNGNCKDFYKREAQKKVQEIKN